MVLGATGFASVLLISAKSVCPAGFCFHVLNRAVARLPLFEKSEDYEALERVIEEAFQREESPIFSDCVMPNHWHFVVRPQTKSQVTGFFRWLTNTHTMRWHAHHHTTGTGHLYQDFRTYANAPRSTTPTQEAATCGVHSVRHTDGGVQTLSTC